LPAEVLAADVAALPEVAAEAAAEAAAVDGAEEEPQAARLSVIQAASARAKSFFFIGILPFQIRVDCFVPEI
jgi:hypothetical protein